MSIASHAIWGSRHEEPHSFAEEMTILRRCCWQFYCLVDELPNDNDFICRSVSAAASAVRRAAQGNGMVRCGFHGWVYDADGVPRRIPAWIILNGEAETVYGTQAGFELFSFSRSPSLWAGDPKKSLRSRRKESSVRGMGGPRAPSVAW